jgi:hypothetical protein
MVVDSIPDSQSQRHGLESEPEDQLSDRGFSCVSSLSPEKFWNILKQAMNSSILVHPSSSAATISSLKMAVLCDVAPCNLVDIDRRFGGTYCLHHRHDVGSSNHFLNVCQDLPDYTVHLRRQPSP